MMVLLHLGYDHKTIENRMELLFPVEMRLKVKNGINNTTLIDDSYSSDFQSLKIALDFLESQKQYKKKTLICRIFSRVACRMRSCILTCRSS
jgi:alanine racemase